AYNQANSAFAEANAAANTVATFANGNLILPDATINFNDSTTVNIAAVANGTTQSNVSFNANAAAIAGPAFNQANNALSEANSAYNQANNAFAQANNAYNQANAAANTVATFANG